MRMIMTDNEREQSRLAYQRQYESLVKEDGYRKGYIYQNCGPMAVNPYPAGSHDAKLWDEAFDLARTAPYLDEGA